MSIGVVVATYGDIGYWGPLAFRALESAYQQTATVEVRLVHADTLAQARNQGAAQVGTDWLVFLDADDELDPGYAQAMAGWAEDADTVREITGSGDWLFQPSTLGVYEDGSEDVEPVLISQRPLLESNYLVIGTMCRRDQFLRLGGFRELPALEDWDLWIRMCVDGAQVGRVPEAIYRVHVSSDSRNQNLERHHATYAQIRELYAGATL